MLTYCVNISVLKGRLGGRLGGGRAPQLVPRRCDELDGFMRIPNRTTLGCAG